MDSFYKFWDKINGELYKGVEPPVKYNFAPYLTSPVNDINGNYQLKTIEKEDTGSSAAKDVEEWLNKYGQNTTKLGDPMTDEELKKHYGHTW